MVLGGTGHKQGRSRRTKSQVPCEQLGIRTPAKEDKARGKASQVVQNPKLHRNGRRVQEVLLYPHVSTKRARTVTVFLIVISSGTITVVLAHQQALREGLKPEGMKGVRNTVQHPRREM